MKDEVRRVQELTDETIRQGGVLAMLYFDVHGASGEEVRNKMVEFVSRISKEPGVLTCYGEVKEPIENQELYSTSAEVKVLTKDYATLVNLGGLYGPISAEVLRPESIKLSMPDAAAIVTTVSATSHQFSTFILNKLLSKEDREKFEKTMKAREEIGQRLVKEGKKVGK